MNYGRPENVNIKKPNCFSFLLSDDYSKSGLINWFLNGVGNPDINSKFRNLF